MVHISNMVIYHIFGLEPWGFHLVSILLHAGVSVVVFLLLSRLYREYRPSTPFSYLPAFIAALLFATDPIHTEAVTWISALTEVAFTFFCLLSFYLYLRSKGGFDGDYLLSVVSFLFAAFFKETALALPMIIVVYDYVFRKKENHLRDYLKMYIPYIAVVAVYLILRFHAIGAFSPLKRHMELSTYQYMINVFPLFAQYLGKLVLPLNLNAFHVLHPIASLPEPKGILSLIIIVAFVAFAIIVSKKNKLAFFSLFFVVIPLLPVLYIPGLGENTFAERYLYLPSFGFVMLLGLLISRVRGNSAGRADGVILLSIVLIGLYSAGTFYRNTVWKDDYTLFSDTVKKAPDSASVRYSLGTTLLYKGNVDEAIENFRTAEKLAPNDALAYYNLGVAYYSKGLKEESIEQLQAAVKMKPDFAKAHYNLGIAYSSEGRTDEAIEQFKTAVKLRPDYVKAYDNLGKAYYSKGLTEEAIKQLETAVKLRPDSANICYNLGVAYNSAGLTDEAIEQFETVVKLNPNFAEAHYDLATLYKKRGLEDEAMKEFRTAIRIKPNLVRTRQAHEPAAK
jgi:tetratricopeptide (TPR) repeat protein